MSEAPATPLPAYRMAKEMLGRSIGWFRAHREELEAAGFPKPLPVTGLYEPGHVKAWKDAQFQVQPGFMAPVDLGALHGGA